MKTVELIKAKDKFQVNGAIQDVDFSTLDLIRQCIATAPLAGLAYQDIKKRMKLEATIDKQESEKPDGQDLAQLVLEDKDYQTLQGIVQEMRWGYLNKFIGQFVSQFD